MSEEHCKHDFYRFVVLDSFDYVSKSKSEQSTQCYSSYDHTDKLSDTSRNRSRAHDSCLHDAIDNQKESKTGSIVEKAFTFKNQCQSLWCSELLEESKYRYRIGSRDDCTKKQNYSKWDLIANSIQ